jgi:hypothetical protein
MDDHISRLKLELAEVKARTNTIMQDIATSRDLMKMYMPEITLRVREVIPTEFSENIDYDSTYESDSENGNNVPADDPMGLYLLTDSSDLNESSNEDNSELDNFYDNNSILGNSNDVDLESSNSNDVDSESSNSNDVGSESDNSNDADSESGNSNEDNSILGNSNDADSVPDNSNSTPINPELAGNLTPNNPQLVGNP